MLKPTKKQIAEKKIPARFTKSRAVRMRYENDFEVQARVDDETIRPIVKTYDGNRLELIMSPDDARSYAFALLEYARRAEDLAMWERAHGSRPKRKS